jgi:predicted metal-dependent peptidase
MSPDELAAGVAVVLGVLGTLRATVTLVAVDAAVQTMTRITAATPAAKIASYLRGGGGTDFRPLFAAATGDTAARRGHPAPRAVLVFTDGGACVPAEAPRGVEVLWVTGPTAATGGNHRRPCAWGQHVEVAV